MRDRNEGGSRSATIVLGLMFIIGGGILLVAQYTGWELPFNLGSVGWPLWIIVPGALMLIIGLITPGEPGTGLAIAGSIVTMVGLLLAYQAFTDHFASWAYAWALVAPTAVGVGMALWGMLHLRADAVRNGLGVLGVGLVMFLIGFAFFEGALQIGGQRGLAPLGRQALPFALIAAGVLLVLTRPWYRRRDEWTARQSAGSSAPRPAEPTAGPSAPPQDEPPS